ncbi:MAG: GGDEF domain-containing protein [Proteobacteria bacterium]|nr:GGDEF domain-containing protein [Pseudomonadota bacterium]MBU1736658.1 GGDEF domain-containing protein [Pseudomonadota bacterium]
MAAVLTRRIFHFFVPGGLLLAACIIFNGNEGMLHWRPVVARGMLLAVPAAALIIGWRFNRFNPVLAVLALVLSELAIYEFVRGTDVDLPLASVVHGSVSVLLPVNLVFLAWSGERGIFNSSGFFKTATLVSQPFLVAWIYSSYPLLTENLAKNIIPFALPVPINIPDFGVLAYGFSLLALFIHLARKRGAVETGFVWALAASYFALSVYSGLLSTICFAFGGLILAVSIIEAAYSMAYRDELTGLAARRSLNELFLRLTGRYTVAMLDIDHFKKFNDTYGHDVGDQVLRMVAARISRVRGGGKPFRYGGEEFTVVFPGKGKEDVLEHLEALRQSIEDSDFYVRDYKRPRKKGDKRAAKGRNPDKKVGVTVSIGVASRDDGKMTAEQLVKAADQALYRAKGKGRNCLVS